MIVRSEWWAHGYAWERRIEVAVQVPRQVIVDSGVIDADAPEGAENDLTPEQISVLRPYLRIGLRRYWPTAHWQLAKENRRWAYVWPDGRIMDSTVPAVVAEARTAVEVWRDRIDDEPLSIPGGRYAVASAQFEHWAGLFHRSLLHRADPAWPFRKVVLARVVEATGEAAGTHELASPAELLALCDARIERHNAVHNARHIVAAEHTPLIDAVEAAWEAGKENWWGIDDADFRAAVDAFLAYDVPGRIRAEAAPDRQEPTAARVADAKAQAIHRLETEAAQRLTWLTGESHTWLSVQQAATWDSSGLVLLVADGRAAITAAETIEAVADAARAATVLVKSWAFDLGLQTQHRLLSRARAIRLVIMGPGPARVAVKLLRDAPGLGNATTPIPDDDYTASQPTQALGRAVTTVNSLITLTDQVPADAVLFAEVTLRAGEGTPVLLRHLHRIGTVPMRT